MIHYLKSCINLNTLGLPGSTMTKNPPGATFSHKASIINNLSCEEVNSSKTYPQYTMSNYEGSNVYDNEDIHFYKFIN